MGYNSRTNIASGGGDLPNEEFIKILGQACNIGWENIKKTKDRAQCCDYTEPNGEKCYCDATEVWLLARYTDKGDEEYQVKLCSIHSHMVKRMLGINEKGGKKS